MSRPLGKAHVAFHPIGRWTHNHNVVEPEVHDREMVEDGSIPLDQFQMAGMTTMQYKYPVKVIIPSHASTSMCQWVYFMSYGGGLVEGDDIQLQLDVQDQCCCLLTTQASTKVFHCEDGNETKQTLTCYIGPEALLAIIPDPVVAFKHAIYSQKQKISMGVDSNLVLLDWMSAGRVALGEIWQFDRVSTNNQVEVDGEVVYREAMCLRDTPQVSLATAMARYKVVGTLLLLGPLLEPLAKILQSKIGKHKSYDESYSCESMTSISPLKYTVKSGTIKGCMVRFMGPSVAEVQGQIDTMLEPLYPVLGGNPLNLS